MASSGTGEWITVHANAGHAFVEIAGIRLETSAEVARARPRAPVPAGGR
jgi:hypothetical protein